MVRRTLLTTITALTAVFSANAELQFSLRYYDKNIYYPGDQIELKLTISNPSDGNDATFYLADDARESFGFNLRSLRGDSVPRAEGFAGALNDRGAYRVVQLAPGRELSMNVLLSQWLDASEPGQYRLTALFYPFLRGAEAVEAEAVLDLTVAPHSDRRWQDALDAEVRDVLIQRDLDPWSIIRETLESRSELRFNRAILYLDTQALAMISPDIPDAGSLERSLLRGSWDSLPGLEHPARDLELISYEVHPSEATVRLRAAYEPYGERFQRELLMFLHRVDGYWSIRRTEAVDNGDVNPLRYGATDLDPPAVIEEMLSAASRGDWEIVLRYYDVVNLVRNLPENAERWKNMSAVEHEATLTEYRRRLISGSLEDGKEPLSDIQQWDLTHVSYGRTEGRITVENIANHITASGTMNQRTMYTFWLSRPDAADAPWRVNSYDTVIVGGEG